MTKGTLVIVAALLIAFLSGVWGDITVDLTALGISEHITHIGTVILTRATEVVAGVAALMHLVLPRTTVMPAEA